jgi:hypothetical protein
MNNNKDLEKNIEDFLSNNKNENEKVNSNPDVSVINNDKSIVERINKKIITEDGRQLLI